MPTKVIDNNEARVPFLSDRMSFITGLDPLGLQNPSSQAYYYLLPGLNNVTSRIRAYSFYCWLLAEYAKIIKSTDPDDQKQFIRRSEYIIALLSVKNNIEGISGINYATNRINENPNEYDLQKGTYNPDGTTEKTYWQYPFGIFGQYYVGSMRQLGLIEEPVNEKGEFLGIYRRTSKSKTIKVTGEDLAEVFENSLDEQLKIVFLSAIKIGKIKTTQLIQLADSFNLRVIKAKERESLKTMLLDIDEPPRFGEYEESMRKQTLVHLLVFIDKQKDAFSQHDFTMYAYSKKGQVGNVTDHCLKGWYYYQYNEYWQYACTAILNGCLDYLQDLKGAGWMPLNELLVKCRNVIMNFFQTNKIIKSQTTTVSELLNTNLEEEKLLYKKIGKEKTTERMALSILLLLKIFKSNKEKLDDLNEYIKERNIGENDDVVSYYLSFDNMLNTKLSDFIELFLLHRIIYRHQYVAYRKMGNGSQSTQKFIIEENHIRQIGNFDPFFTSPRISNLINFLYDLKLLDTNYNLSASGKQLLNELTSK